MKRIVILISLVFAFFINGCDTQSHKILEKENSNNSNNNNSVTNKNPTKTNHSSTHSVNVTIIVTDKQGNPLQTEISIDYKDIGISTDKNGEFTRPFRVNSKHTVIVPYGNKDVKKEFFVPNHSVTIQLQIPE